MATAAVGFGSVGRGWHCFSAACFLEPRDMSRILVRHSDVSAVLVAKRQDITLGTEDCIER
jgi:hypothetical protein